MRTLQHSTPTAGSKPAPGVPAIVLITLATLLAPTHVAKAQRLAPKSERELLAILRSDAPEADKALACKHLSVVGASEAVPELAKLLANERLASWARIALEVIPGTQVDEALRKSTESLQGRLLVGVINSIGVRRDAGAVDLLSKRLADQDGDVASAAAVALGRIGNPAAADPLRKALAAAPPLKIRSAIAEGCILCAERRLADGNAAEAAKIYDEVRTAEVPRQRMLEATRGAILARGEDGIPLLVEQLKSQDKGLFQIALSTAREISGREVDQALAAELGSAFPERAALIVVAMADRPNTDLPAVLKAAGGGHKQVRVAAISALGRIGNATALAPLLDAAVDSDAEIATAAKESLAVLPGETVDKDIAARLAQAQGKLYLVLIELVGQRRIDAIPALVKALDHSDRAVRTAALTSLGNTVPDKYLSVLIDQVLAPKDSETAPVAQTALKTAAVRMPDREACAAQLAAAMNRAPAATKVVLLETLAAVGGTRALAAVGAAAKGSDAALQDAGSRLLGEWMTIDAAPVLLDLSKSSGRFQGRALRGYLRIARQFTASDEQRADMFKNALEAARSPADQKLVLEAIQRYPHVEMLKLAVRAAQVPELKEDAKGAAKAISEKLRKTDEVRELLSKAGVEK